MSLTFLQHYPYSWQHGGNEVNEISGFGSPGETVSLSFSLISNRNHQTVELHSVPLAGESQSLGAESVDIYIVKVWEQAGIALYQAERMNVPELLLKDDRVRLMDGYRRHFKRKRHLIEPLRLYEPPKVRLKGHAATSLIAGQSKQIFVKIRIPTDTTAGAYHGAIEITLSRGMKRRLNISLDVLPIHLAEPKQDLIMAYKGCLSWQNRQHFVPADIFKAQLTDIYETGFRSLAINEFDTESAQHAIDIAEAIGFDRYILFSPASIDRDKLRFRKLTPIFFISDEIDAHIHYRSCEAVGDVDEVKHHMHNLARSRNFSDSKLCTVLNQAAAVELYKNNEIGPVPQILSFSLPHNKDFFFFRKQFEALRTQKTYYYWPAHMEKPDLHRVLTGLYLWKSEADGVQPYCYQHLPKYPFSPFNDFDEWEPVSDFGEEPRSFKDHMSTYPSKFGPIPTLQWQGMREGINDLKYLTTLDQALKSAESSSDSQKQQEAQNIRLQMQEFTDKVDLRSINITSDTNPAPYDAIAPEDYHRFREFMARSLVRLQSNVECFVHSA